MVKQSFKLNSADRIAFSPDSKSLATLGNKLVVWDVGTGERRFLSQPLSHISEFVYSPNGKKILLKNTSGEIVIVDSNDGQLVLRIDRPATPGQDGCHPVFSPCGKYIVDGTWDGRLVVYSIRTGRSKFEKQFTNEMISGVMFLPGGASAYILNQQLPSGDESDDDFTGEPYLNSWKWPFWQSTPKRQHGAMPESCDLYCSETGKHFACIEEYDTLCVYLIRGRKQIYSFSYDDFIKRIQWSADGQWLAVATGDVIDLRHVKDFGVNRLCEHKGASDFAFSPDGKWVAIAAGTNSSAIHREHFFSEIAE